MANKDYRPGFLLINKSVSTNKKEISSTSSVDLRSASSAINLEDILRKSCWAVKFLKRALYPYVIIRMLGIASGSRSLNHMTPVSLWVHVSIASPFKPWIATKLRC